MNASEMIASYKQVPVRFTADEFMEIVQHPPIALWSGKIELVDGEIVRMSPANIPHWRVQHDTAQRLRALLADNADWLVGPEPTVRFADGAVRLPDIGVFRQPDLSLSVFDAAALFLAVEVADTSLRIDLGPKLRAYADAGVPHYWVVDLNAHRTHVMTDPRAGTYWSRQLVPFGEPIVVPSIPLTMTID
jgi:Uma2 family endonuclease